jgi:hypothetical protein
VPDDFTAFAGSEHMFHGLGDPYGLIREEVERALGEVAAIVTHGDPKWLTIARRTDAGTMVVAYFGVCVRARLTLVIDYGREVTEATATLLFGRWDQPDEQRLRTYFDLHADAERGYEDDLFQARFLAFREDDP